MKELWDWLIVTLLFKDLYINFTANAKQDVKLFVNGKEVLRSI